MSLVTGAPTSEAAEAVCEQARREQAEVPGLLAAGRLHRALQTLEHATQSCPAQRRSTRAAEVEALAEIGRYEEARALATDLKTTGSPRERTAARRALRIIEERDRSFPDLAQAEAARERIRARAVEVARQAEAGGATGEPSSDTYLHAQASQLYEQAWAACHPAGALLARAGHYAQLAGDAARAQRLFDRALFELERQSGAKVTTGLRDVYHPQSVAWSPTGGLLALAAHGGITVLDATSLEERHHFAGAWPTRVVFSPDGTQVAAVLDHRSVRIWRLEDGQPMATLPGGRRVIEALAFSSGGDQFVTRDWEGTVEVRQVEGGTLVQALPGPNLGVRPVAFSPGASLVATSSGTHEFRIQRIRDGAVLRTQPGARATTLAFSPDGALLATASTDGAVRLWRWQEGLLLGTRKTDVDRSDSLVFSPDGQWLALGSQLDVVLWRLSEFTRGDHAPHSLPGCREVAFAPDGATLLCCGTQELMLWSVPDGRPRRRLERVSDWDGGLSFSRDGTALLSQRERFDPIRWWGMRGPVAFRQIDEEHTGAYEHLAVVSSRANTYLVARSPQGTVELRDVPDGALVVTLQGSTEADARASARVTTMQAVALSPRGDLLATRSMSPRVIRLWRATDGAPLRSLDDPTLGRSDLVFSPNGKLLATGHEEGVVHVWSTRDGTLRHVFEDPLRYWHSIAFSADSRILAMGSGKGGLEFWKLGDGTLLEEWETPEPLSTLAFSHDGSWIAGATARETLLWRTQDQHLLRSFETEGSTIALSSDDSWLAVGDLSGRIRVLRVRDGSERLSLQPIAGAEASYVSTPTGAFELVGSEAEQAAPHVFCRIGSQSFPLELCAERLHVPGLLQQVLGGGT